MKQDASQIWRIFAENLSAGSSSLVIEGDELHFLANVLRLREGENIEISNGKGIVAAASIANLTKKNAIVSIKKIVEVPKPVLDINICVGMPKNTAAEEVVASVAELGATRILFFLSEKTHTKQPIKLPRFQKLAREAMRISKTSWETEVVAFDNLEALFKNIEDPINTYIVCDESPHYRQWETSGQESSNKNLLQVLQTLKSTSKIFIFIGPEASFSSKERELLGGKGAVPVSLGANILRVPTAAAAATALTLAALSS